MRLGYDAGRIRAGRPRGTERVVGLSYSYSTVGVAEEVAETVGQSSSKILSTSRCGNFVACLICLKRLAGLLIPRKEGDAELCPNEKMVDVSRLSNVHGCVGMDKSFQS